MSFRPGACSCVSDCIGILPRASLASRLSESRQVRLSLSQPSIHQQSSTHAIENALNEDASESGWWAWIDSGMLTNSMFLTAQILYLIATYDYNFENDSEEEVDQHQKRASWLYFWAALLYVAESSIDLGWSLKVWVVEARLREAKRELKNFSGGGSSSTGAGRPSSALLDTLGQELCCPSFDTVPWGFWAALWFVIPSLLYLVAALLDPNVASWHWLNWGQWNGMSDADYATLADKLAAALFLLDALIGLAGRYSIRRQVLDDDKLSLAPWSARDFFALDWAAYGDSLFFVGAIVGVVQQFREYNAALDWVTNSLWTLDAVFYMIASFPVLRALLKNRTVVASRLAT